MSEITINYRFDGNPALVTLRRTGQEAVEYRIPTDELAGMLTRLLTRGGLETRTISPASVMIRGLGMIAAPTTGGCRIAKRFPERELSIRYAPGSDDARDARITLPPTWWILEYTPDGNISNTRLAVETEGKVSAWPYGNCHEAGTVCWGNHNTVLQKGTPDEIDAYFFGLPFNRDIPANAEANRMLGTDGAKLIDWYLNHVGTQTIDDVVGGEMLRRPVPRPEETPNNDGEQQQAAGGPNTPTVREDFHQFVNRAGTGNAGAGPAGHILAVDIETGAHHWVPAPTGEPNRDEPRPGEPVRTAVPGGGPAGPLTGDEADGGGDRG